MGIQINKILSETLKYTFSIETLNKLYCTCIRSSLAYASEVWDVYNQADIDQLEHVQLKAARSITGLPTFASYNSIYYETRGEILAERREKEINPNV